jgi:hypothetical protein
MAELTEEQKEARRANLARARAARTTRRTEAAAAPSDEALLSAAPVAVLDAPERPDPKVAAQAAFDRRNRLLAGLDAETAALITDEQLATIEAEEQAKAKAKRVKQALDDARNVLRQQAEVDHDLIPAARLLDDAARKRMFEPVTFKVHLPHGGAGHGEAFLRVDGFRYRDGETYTRPRHVFESLQPMLYNVHLHELRFSMLNQNDSMNSAKARLGEIIPRFEVPTNGA